MMKNSKHTEERKMADIRDSKNWGFETKQLHIGQEKADPVTDARAVPIYASTSYVFHNSQHAADRFDFAMPEIFMEDLPTLQRMFSSRELLLLKAELQRLQLLPVQQLSIIHSRHLQKQVSTL